ncbi:MAG: molybdenum cofactor guanylyltransferase [Actinobacteria bacterium]|nr:molybdenum cofactor guanylyltransferase [Actinomycetota bacterium]
MPRVQGDRGRRPPDLRAAVLRPGPRVLKATRGAVLAGGRGSRLGGAKPTATLSGRPLIAYPLQSLTEAGLTPFIVAKPSTDLRGRPLARSTGQRTTALGDVEIAIEPEEPTHPLAGIVAALRHAGAPVVVLGCDFPFAPPALLRSLAEAPEPLVVPAPGGDPQPLMARWSPQLLPSLEDALAREEPLRRTIASLAPRALDDTELARFGDPARAFFNVNTPEDLRAAEALA